MTAGDSDITSISQRIEGVIKFTLIKYTFNVLIDFIDVQNIFFICLWIAVIILCVQKTGIKDHTITEMLNIFKKLSILLCNQCILYSSTLSIPMHSREAFLMTFFNLTAVLAFAFLFSKILQIPSYTNQGLTLLLYMYTDESNTILRRLNLELIAVIFLTAVYTVTHTSLQKQNKDSTVSQIYMRAVNMIAVNLILNSLLTLHDVTNVHTSAMLSIGFLYIIHALETIWKPLMESKDYALWKSAQNLYQLYSKYESDDIISFFIVTFFFISKAFLTRTQLKKLSILIQLLSLFFINVLLGSVSKIILDTSSVNQIVVMLVYVVLIHYGSSILLLYS